MSLTEKIKKFAKEIDGNKISERERISINKSLWEAGLDGNGRFDRPEGGYVAAVDVLQKHGVELSDVVSSFNFSNNLDHRYLKINISFSNKEDLHSPMPIENSILVLSWTKLRDDVYETLAYLS